jgi:hypothetical protein
VGLIVPIMLTHITYGTYIFFLGFMLMGIAYAIWILPETYCKSLEEMVCIVLSRSFRLLTQEL